MASDALTRWRARCEVHIAQNRDAGPEQHRRIGICQGVAVAVAVTPFADPTWTVHVVEQAVARREGRTFDVGTPDEFLPEGLKLALRWLKEEVERVSLPQCKSCPNLRQEPGPLVKCGIAQTHDGALSALDVRHDGYRPEWCRLIALEVGDG